MTDERSYPAGVPCWIDTEQPDIDAARHFYAGLFGWAFSDAVPADAPGTYLIATLDGADVAAIGPADDATATWNTYIAVDDADAVSASVRAAGGTVTVEPVDAGRVAGSRAAPIPPVPTSGCGSRAADWARRLPMRRAAGTSAISTPRTRQRRRPSMRRYLVGNSTMWASLR